jgi:hypothetical protein
VVRRNGHPAAVSLQREDSTVVVKRQRGRARGEASGGAPGLTAPGELIGPVADG